MAWISREVSSWLSSERMTAAPVFVLAGAMLIRMAAEVCVLV